MFTALCVYVVYACACVVCRMCVCLWLCVRARDSHGMMMDPYDIARLFLSTNERKGEKDREEKRARTS